MRWIRDIKRARLRENGDFEKLVGHLSHDDAAVAFAEKIHKCKCAFRF